MLRVNWEERKREVDHRRIRRVDLRGRSEHGFRGERYVGRKRRVSGREKVWAERCLSVLRGC